MSDKYERQMEKLGFTYSGSGDYCLRDNNHTAAAWVWKVPAGSASHKYIGAGWLKPYPRGSWVADLNLSTEELEAGKGVAFDDPVSAATYILTAGFRPGRPGESLPGTPFTVN